MKKQYEEEIKKLKAQMEKAESFAKKIPIFSEYILKEKLNGEEVWRTYGKKYKQIPLDWGIYRALYASDSRRTITNYRNKPYKCFLWSIYINQFLLFDIYDSYGLNDAVADLDLFFYDKLNTTFYATDEQIEPLLETLNEWYIKAIVLDQIAATTKEIDKCEQKLSALKNKLAKLNEQEAI